MYKANRNKGIYYELTLLIDYIEDDYDLDLLDSLLKDFSKDGLNLQDLRIVLELIEDYLPEYIECDYEGCYISQCINNLPTYTYFTDIKEEHTEQLERILVCT